MQLAYGFALVAGKITGYLESTAMSSTPTTAIPRLTSLSHGGGCGCKIAPGVLSEILKSTSAMPIPPQLLVGIETADDAAVYQLNDAISDVYAMGGTPIMALALVGMPINVLPAETIGKILDGGQSVCREAGIPIAGGHTIDSVEPIYGLVVLGLVHPKRIKRNADARVGDRLILGKPLGVGVLSAALKKNALTPEGYAQMIANTTQLNTPGAALSALAGVHAMTDVTGFGLAGHALEMARGSHQTVQLNMSQVPLLHGVRDLAEQGMLTGASGRNWSAYGNEIELAPARDAIDQALLSDPQTSGGLLVACAPESVAEVLAVFHQHGFEQACEVGEIKAAAANGIKLQVR
jgi:selenide,water dikinase